MTSTAIFTPGTSRRSPLRPMRTRRRVRTTAMDSALRQLSQVVAALNSSADTAALTPLEQELDGVRDANQLRLRPALLRLRSLVEQIRAVAARGEQPPTLVLERLREVGTRLMEADWLARRATTRAAAVAVDLRHLCAVSSEVEAEVCQLLGLARQTEALVHSRAA